MLTGRLAGRFGHRPFLIGGALLYAAAALWFMLVPGDAAVVPPALAARAPDERRQRRPRAAVAVGRGGQQAAGAALRGGQRRQPGDRQIGSVIGVAIIVLLLGHGTVQRSDFDAVYALHDRPGAADRRLVRNGRHPAGRAAGMSRRTREGGPRSLPSSGRARCCRGSA